MADSNSPDSEQKIDEAITQILDVTDRVLNALNNSTDLSKSGSNNLDCEIQQAEKAQIEQRKVLETENERKRQQLARKWKRY